MARLVCESIVKVVQAAAQKLTGFKRLMKRMVAFSDCYGLTIELAYYPPYHSKYNRIEPPRAVGWCFLLRG